MSVSVNQPDNKPKPAIHDNRFERFFSSSETLEITGASTRRLHYWITNNFLQSDHQQPTGSGRRWSFPYIDVLKIDLASTLMNHGVEVAQAFQAVNTLNVDGLPFNGSYLTTTPTKTWTIITTTEPAPNQLLHVVVNLETAIDRLDTRIAELNQSTLPFQKQTQ